MLVTGIPRSGSTKFCLDLSKSLGYNFYDEIFEIGVSSFHKTIGLHEVNLDVIHPKTPSFIKTIDFDKSVINNHEINFFILEKTDIFLSRRNVQDAVWSFLAHTHKLVSYQHPSLDTKMMNVVMRQIQHRWFDRIIFFYDYVVEYDKQITIPDLIFPDSSGYRERFAEFAPAVTELGKRLTLPDGLVYQ
jgi:hypothetical protein